MIPTSVLHLQKMPGLLETGVFLAGGYIIKASEKLQGFFLHSQWFFLFYGMP